MAIRKLKNQKNDLVVLTCFVDEPVLLITSNEIVLRIFSADDGR